MAARITVPHFPITQAVLRYSNACCISVPCPSPLIRGALCLIGRLVYSPFPMPALMQSFHDRICRRCDIISGMPGDFVMDSVHGLGVTDSLPSRKASYELQRYSNRETIRRGRK